MDATTRRQPEDHAQQRLAAFWRALSDGSANELRAVLAEEPALAHACDERGLSALLKARYAGRFAVVEALLEARGANIDLFECAALDRSAQLERHLAAQPVLVRAWSPDGFGALHLAAFFGSSACVRALLSRGAPVDVEAQNPMRVRPLHSAVAGGDEECVRLLLSAGAQLEARQNGGFTALMGAAAAGRADLARLLLKHGASRAARDDAGKRACDHASLRGHVATAQLLQ
jgi:ankyrin repeat protein